jgi:hypothetical protein
MIPIFLVNGNLLVSQGNKKREQARVSEGL